MVNKKKLPLNNGQTSEAEAELSQVSNSNPDTSNDSISLSKHHHSGDHELIINPQNGHASSENSDVSSDYGATENGIKSPSSTGDGFVLVTKRKQRSRNQGIVKHMRGAHNNTAHAVYRQKSSNGNNARVYKCMYRAISGSHRQDNASSCPEALPTTQPQVVSVGG